MSQKLPDVPCQIPELKLSCFGCCGDTFKSKEEVELDIEENTIEFNELMDVGQSLEKFRDRFDGDILGPSGLCMNLVEFKSGCLACPLHPKINELVPKEETVAPKKDIRLKPCDVNYECKTFKKWKLMTNLEKREYVDFLKSKRNELDNYSYSMGSHDGLFLDEHSKLKNK